MQMDFGTNGFSSAWNYQYDTLGQLSNAWKTANGSVVPGRQYGYQFDDIGNRKQTTRGNNRSGLLTGPTPVVTSDYTANLLNQYSQRTVPAYAEISGTANPDAILSFRNEDTGTRIRAGRNADWFHAFMLLTDNYITGTTNAVRMTAVLPGQGASGTDLINTNQTLALSAMKTPEIFDFDDDGNLLSDGRFTYTWNAENRLIQVSNFQFQVSYAYDHQGRRVQKQLYELITNNWELITETKFLWNGNHIISEICCDPSEMQTNVSSFVWGNNGQLVSFVTKAQGLEPQAFFYCHDGNKNVTDLVNASGAIVAHYEYDPFGNQVVKSGVLADTNPFRFSNEYYDSETGFTTYLYRPYNPETGAWLSRDPIGTRGGLNVYGFTGNRSISLTDFQGLSVALPQNEGRLNLKASGVVDIFNYLDMEVLLVSGSGMDSEFDKDTNTATIDMEHDDPWSQLVHEVVGGSIWGSGGNPDSFGFPGAVKYYDTQTVSIIGEMLARIDRNNGEDRLGVALEQHLQQHTGSYTYSYPKALKIVEFVKACECGGGFRDDERVVSQISDSVGSPVSGFVTGRLKVIVKIVYEVGCRNRKPWADYEIGYYK